MPVIQAICGTGVTTLEAMTQALNQRGIRSARGGRWYASSVANLLARAGKLPEYSALLWARIAAALERPLMPVVHIAALAFMVLVLRVGTRFMLTAPEMQPTGATWF